MGARQSMEERPRSNSMDTSAAQPGPGQLGQRGASRSVLSAADFVQVGLGAL